MMPARSSFINTKGGGHALATPRLQADNIEGELRSELSILRHQIYELRKRSRPLEEDRFLPAFSAPQRCGPGLDVQKAANTPGVNGI